VGVACWATVQNTNNSTNIHQGSPTCDCTPASSLLFPHFFPFLKKIFHENHKQKGGCLMGGCAKYNNSKYSPGIPCMWLHSHPPSLHSTTPWHRVQAASILLILGTFFLLSIKEHLIHISHKIWAIGTSFCVRQTQDNYEIHKICMFKSLCCLQFVRFFFQ